MMRIEENMNNSKIPENTYDENMELWNHCWIPEIIIWESSSYFRLFLMPGWITFSANLSIVPFICPRHTIIIFIIINPHLILYPTKNASMGNGHSWNLWKEPIPLLNLHEPIVEMAGWSTLERFSRVEKASKHLKGQLDPPVSDVFGSKVFSLIFLLVTFLDQRWSVGTSCWWRF